MPICIECRYPVHQLYTTYSRADDRTLGKGVRLTQCPRCKRFADKYVEHDFVVLFIDLVLIKPQVYRHLLFNRLGRDDDRFDVCSFAFLDHPSIIRLGILLLLFDVYMVWSRIEKAAEATHPASAPSLLSSRPLFLQYLFFLLLCSLSTLAFHLPIRLLCAHPPRAPAWVGDTLPFLRSTKPSRPTAKGHPQQPPATTASSTASSPSTSPTSASAHDPALPRVSADSSIPLLPHYPHPAPLSTALFVSSCTKLFPILLIIWKYDLPSSASAVSWAVIANNVAALDILMDCGLVRATALVAVGAVARELVGQTVLRLVGLAGRDGDVGGGIQRAWRFLVGWAP